MKVHYRSVSKTVTIDPSVGTSPESRRDPRLTGSRRRDRHHVHAGEPGAGADAVRFQTMPAVGPVDYSDEIAKAAQAHAQDAQPTRPTSHDSLDGQTFDQRIAATKYRGSPGGENIASSFPTARRPSRAG